MKLHEAKTILDKYTNVSFSEIFTKEQLNYILVNKGKTGQILELLLGLNLSNTTLDFEDGELKTNKCTSDGLPLETIFITQVASIIDSILAGQPFEETRLFAKIEHILYVPIDKTGVPGNWKFLPCIEIKLSAPEFSNIKEQLEKDYNSIQSQLNTMLTEDENAMLHTISGEYIQIRTKDSKPYTPIYSTVYSRNISNKGRAFYFKKDFILAVRAILS